MFTRRGFLAFSGALAVASVAAPAQAEIAYNCNWDVQVFVGGSLLPLDKIDAWHKKDLVESVIRPLDHQLFLEVNDEIARASVKDFISPWLESYRVSRELYDYKVVCDEINNSPSVIDEGKFVIDIFSKWTRSIGMVQTRMRVSPHTIQL